MLKALETGGPISRLGRDILIISVVLALLLVLAKGMMYAPFMLEYRSDVGTMQMIITWAAELSYLFNGLMLVGALLFVGGKFVETRTILTVGFAKLDADKMRLKGPDEDHVVWVGQRYGSKFEAEAMAAALQNRMQESAEKPAP
jgi:hypothetical protein